MSKTATAPVQFRLNAIVLAQIDNLAGAANLDRAEYLKLWCGTISRLKRERAIDAISAIPKDYFKGLPGRPSDSTGYDAQP